MVDCFWSEPKVYCSLVSEKFFLMDLVLGEVILFELMFGEFVLSRSESSKRYCYIEVYISVKIIDDIYVSLTSL